MRSQSLIRALPVVMMLSAADAAAQPGLSPGPQVASPEVHADRRVTVWLVAPKADSVTLTGEITTGRPPIPMAKDARGVWTATVGPLAPDIYTYQFVVDGVALPDPLNGYVKTGPGGLFTTSSLVEVPGDGPQYYDARAVPHGIVSLVQYDSKSLGVPRRALVYTPPGYDAAARTTYPLAILMHGIGETEADWVLVGRANQILDNAIADGRARPMVVVMPLGHAQQSVGIGPMPNRQPGYPMRGDPFAFAQIQRDLFEDLLPLVERGFRVSRDPDERAIMGLSLGGAQALRIGLNNPDRFHWVAGFSSALVEREPTAGYQDVLANAAALNRTLRMVRLTIGKDDFLVAGNRQFSAMLEKAGVTHSFTVGEGAHEWRVWRRDLRDVLPLLFRR